MPQNYYGASAALFGRGVRNKMTLVCEWGLGSGYLTYR